MQIETRLLFGTGEGFDNRTRSIHNNARVDLRSRVFWVIDEQAYFDIKLFSRCSNRYPHTAVPQSYIYTKKKKSNDNITREFHKSTTEALVQ